MFLERNTNIAFGQRIKSIIIIIVTTIKMYVYSWVFRMFQIRNGESGLSKR